MSWPIASRSFAIRRRYDGTIGLPQPRMESIARLSQSGFRAEHERRFRLPVMSDEARRHEPARDA
jgi:hypothetical protein